MKITDIQKLHDASLITGEERQKIVEQFTLKEDGGNNFLAIVSIIGTVLTRATSRNRPRGKRQIPVSFNRTTSDAYPPHRIEYLVAG